MTNKLLTGLRQNTNYTRTENNAVTHISTLNDVLDLFYHAPARRGQDNTQLFAKAYREDPLHALKVAFYVRDIRGGQGERNTFRQVLRYLFNHDRAVFDKLVTLVPVYGRWDDVLEFVESVTVQNMVWEQLRQDSESAHPSLLAKWMPSINTSSKKTAALGMKWSSAFGISPRQYRKLLVNIRRKITLVESLMSAKAFDEINYAHVPSRAAMIYRKAFSKRDGERYVAYLADVKSGKSEIKAATLYPYEIVGKYLNGHSYDETLELQWNALPNYVEANDENAIVVADVSGSMSGRPMEVSISLAMYIAERNNGAFKDHFITFSGNPTLQRIKGSTVYGRVQELRRAAWEMNTNIQAVFDLILNTAMRNDVPQSDMPRKIFIVSDMEFDSTYVGGKRTNFDVIKEKYARAGYEMPTLIFWNVDSRNDQTPVTQNEKGVFLVAGASPSIFKAAINARATTPVEMMLETINTPRYAAIEEALM